MVAIDPLLALLQRYLVERKAFDDAAATEGTTDQDWDRIAETTWSHMQDQIIQFEPPGGDRGRRLVGARSCFAV
jgi:hypothetical protein